MPAVVVRTPARRAPTAITGAVRRTAVAVLLLILTACGGADGEPADDASAATAGAATAAGRRGAAEVAERYFSALAQIDYATMADLSTGLAHTAARYGLQVLAADPDAFTARDLEVVEPLVAVDGSDELDGLLDLTTKGLGGTPLRISEIRVEPAGDGWVVADYARDGRPLAEVFRDLEVEIVTDDLELRADLVLTDPVAGVLLLPVTITAGGEAVSVDADTTTAGAARVPLTEGAGRVGAGEEAVLALTFGDVADPAALDAVQLGLLVGRRALTLDVPLR
jgi:hypothetical protein